MKPQINNIVSRSILTKASGFLTGFSHSLNPYSGCAFGCSYCYVRELPVGLYREEEWGTWVDIKTNSADLVLKELAKAKRKGPAYLFMSSSTDPYQPIDSKTQLTRSILEVMVEEPPDFLHVQTRSPLVTRDIDLLQKLGKRVLVSMTIETDIDKVRKLFSPAAPPIQGRLRALKIVTEAGIPTQASVSPLLPSSKQFASTLKKATNHAVLDDLFMGDGARGRRTEKLGIGKVFKENGLESWYSPNVYKTVLARLKEEFPEVQTLVNQHDFQQ